MGHAWCSLVQICLEKPSNSLLTDPIVVGKVIILPNNGVVAQLVRASACHAEGRGFESRPSRHYKLRSDNMIGNSPCLFIEK